MQVVPFWGCMIPLKYPQIESAVRFCLHKLGIELVEDDRFSCCPDPIYFKAGDKTTWYTLAARNICLAEEKGLDIITMCSGCTSTLCEVNFHLKHDKKLREKINENLKPIGKEYKGSIQVRHLVTLLRDEVGLGKMKETVLYPLNDLKIAIHYGCHLLKPSEIMQVEDPVVPSILSELIQIMGATPVNHQEYLMCCGKACQDQDLMLNMSHSIFQSIADSGADCLGLICPTCFDSFDIGQIRVSRKFNKKYGIPVVYLFQLLALTQGASTEQVGIQFHKIMPEEFLEKLQFESLEIMH
ncbi:MAG: CoB--CoM heterodisulfide reductase iron-sulfur subunit B family protein [Calditrichia bacterium]